MKRAALYARVSTDRQQQEQTIESQVVELKKQIARAGNVLVKEYIDDGYSGALLDRPALEQLRQEAKTDAFDAIYFHSTDRLARKVAHQTIIVDELLRCKKQVVIAGKDFVRNPENTLTLTMLGAFAEFEREKIIERTTRGWRHRIRSGGLVSQGNCTFGYDYIAKTRTAPCQIVVNDQEAEIVRWIFETYASGTGVHRITRTLEERGVHTKRGTKLWRTEKLRYLLQNHTYAGIRYFNSMTCAEEPLKGHKRARVYRDRSEWVGVPVPAIVSQELFDRVQARMREAKERYRHPVSHYLLGGLVECGECGAGYSSYRRYVGRELRIGKRRIYHKAAYKCNHRAQQYMHARENVKRCKNPEIATHLLEDAVFDIIGEHMLDPTKLRACMEALKSAAERDEEKLAQSLMALARKIQAAEDRKRQLIDLYASGHLVEAAYVDANVSLDKELAELKRKKTELVEGLPLLHRESIELSIRQFCDTARMRFDHCKSFDEKRQFLLEHVERIIYERYSVTVIGSVPIKMQLTSSQQIETRKIAFSLRGKIDTTTLHTKPRKKFAEDARLREYGSGGRKPPTVSPVPACSVSALAREP
jgi:site-specific DNA recombinase